MTDSLVPKPTTDTVYPEDIVNNMVMHQDVYKVKFDIYKEDEDAFIVIFRIHLHTRKSLKYVLSSRYRKNTLSNLYLHTSKIPSNFTVKIIFVI